MVEDVVVIPVANVDRLLGRVRGGALVMLRRYIGACVYGFEAGVVPSLRSSCKPRYRRAWLTKVPRIAMIEGDERRGRRRDRTHIYCEDVLWRDTPTKDPHTIKPGPHIPQGMLTEEGRHTR